MLNFEEELQKFHPSVELDQQEESLYAQDTTDLADVLVGLIRDARIEGEEAAAAAASVEE
ncbi:MAG: hypothetical protein KBS85_05200 [Lachnospiraceae bacterium]|nr:hypothetical protein [Candidatus Merdinaster equi]